jgi:hypothetical protein
MSFSMKNLFSTFMLAIGAFTFAGAQTPACPKTFSAIAIKTNVLYLGVDNPVQVIATGVPADSLDVVISEGSIERQGGGNYIARVTAVGRVSVVVSTKDKKYKAALEFRAKRLPDPSPALGLRYTRSDTLAVETFKAQPGIMMVLEDFDFDARCITTGYSVTQITTNESDGKQVIRTARNLGGKFNPEAQALVKSARPGDVFIFGDITGKCPGDDKDRLLNSLVFSIGN